MHANELVNLAGLVASRAPLFLQIRQRLPEIALEAYWSASKCRLDRWGYELTRLKETIDLADPYSSNHQHFWPLADEIVTGEILTRVWTAVLAAHDQSHGSAEAEPIARSVLLGHMEAGNRLLKLINSVKGWRLSDLVELQRVRRSSERWTDLLLSQLLPLVDPHELAHEPDRLADFAGDRTLRPADNISRARWSLLLSSLRASFDRPHTLATRNHSPNFDLNRRIGEGILACLRPELFDDAGPLRSPWLLRMSNVADDTEALVNSLLSEPSDRHEGNFQSPGRRIPPSTLWEDDRE
ncbi:MAG: hypothetical protein SGJ20_18440 [Planctomycetota bacterium]|nr:hypothetical protein [Planctomycetota bacterium]